MGKCERKVRPDGKIQIAWIGTKGIGSDGKPFDDTGKNISSIYNPGGTVTSDCTRIRRAWCKKFARPNDGGTCNIIGTRPLTTGEKVNIIKDNSTGSADPIFVGGPDVTGRSTPGQRNTNSRLSPQDQDCSGFGGPFAFLLEQVCVAGKGSTKALDGLILPVILIGGGLLLVMLLK